MMSMDLGSFWAPLCSSYSSLFFQRARICFLFVFDLILSSLFDWNFFENEIG